ncbi:MAG: glycoside hydrolase family 42, partial [Bacteroidia bacterium]
SFDEYGKKRKNKLTTSKGKLIILDDASQNMIRKFAIKEISGDLPDLVVSSDNGNDFKTTISRVVRKSDGTYLVNLLNVGHDSATIRLSFRNGRKFKITDMMTSVEMNNHFNLASEQVLLIEVKPL